MMSKLSSLGNVKELLIAHGEKVVVAAIGVLVALLIWAAIGVPRIESSHQPSALKELAEAARANIDSTTVEAILEEEGFKANPIQDKLEIEPLDVDEYRITKSLNPRIWEAKVKREDPTLLPVAELEVRTDYGAIAVNPDADLLQAGGRRRDAPKRGGPAIGGLGGLGQLGGPGDAIAARRRNTNAEGRRWALIVGLVPYRKQIAEYDRVFHGAEGYDRDRDHPEYGGYLVERREVVKGKPSGWVRLDPFQESSVKAMTKRWARGEQEVVDRRFVNPNLVFPLPPLVPDDWDEQVTHSKVPLAKEEEDLAPNELRDDENDQVQPFNVFGGGADEEARQRDLAKQRAQREQRMADRLGRRLGPSKPPKFYLLRFFDFKVEPGHAYQYRIRLALADPNHDVEGKYLAPEVLERSRKSPWRIGPPSKPSAPAVVPYEATVLAGPAKARANAEPKTTVLLRKLDMKTGETTQVEDELYRGGVGNFTGKVKAVAPKEGTFTGEIDGKVNTQVLLLDIRGGEKISSVDRSLVQPSELLLLDAAGNFFVRDEIEDASELRRHRKLGARKRSRAPGLGGADEPRGVGRPDRDQRRQRPGARNQGGRPGGLGDRPRNRRAPGAGRD